MPKKESLQHKLDRVRRPRVQITYDVEIGDAMEVKELPFTMAVLGDFSGKPDKPLPKLADRKLTEIDRDNFNKVLAAIAPRLAMRVEDRLSGEEGKELGVELRFKDMDDFSPENVAKQIEPLRQLLETRSQLKDLLAKVDGNDKLEDLLNEVLTNTDLQNKLKGELGSSEAAPTEE